MTIIFTDKRGIEAEIATEGHGVLGDRGVARVGDERFVDFLNEVTFEIENIGSADTCGCTGKINNDRMVRMIE